jgi:hypothetical protein
MDHKNEKTRSIYEGVESVRIGIATHSLEYFTTKDLGDIVSQGRQYVLILTLDNFCMESERCLIAFSIEI